MLGYLQREEVDLCTVAAPSSSRIKVASFVRSYPIDLVTLISLKPQPLPKYLALIRPFTGSVWVAVLVSVVVWGVTLWMFQRLWSRVTGGPKVQLSKILMYSWGAILEVPPPEPSVTVSGQILIGWWLLYCLVIFTGYQSSLISHLTIDTAKTKPPETMDDLVKRDGWSWGIESWILTGIPLEYFSRHTDPVVQKIYRNLEVSCQLRLSKMSGIPEGL
ncbi:hypothetical protein Pcinc_009096 [Petrolisthes cinctipes]|uniref:Ionotropic glutamate receptor C-terminal domain-containing protein n=1 Tax=Petrolisthes cinctipes TaxID=88211 RepID=A0AAE1FPR8_PETCI|nr:hypothetical protein Pcinc_017893 [Petrolisthes cinctipes]KAK3883532.1 hypothetical protein Pcinc_012157 [Petrolisthes cinctipes]KAK3886776.1 hypothetical protein Pcinc_009096 [Petrolisthes cinctipes]